MIKGIDVSSYQKNVDWNKVKNSDIKFVILRHGYGDNVKSQDDKVFEEYYAKCKELGIPVGTYLYSYADSIEHAKSEVEHTLRLINGKSFEYGVWYDLEDANTTGKCSNDMIAEMAELYCTEIEKAGFNVGIYANKYWFTNKLTNPIFNNYKKWCASYGINDGNVPEDIYKYQENHDIWQYTSNGSVEGIEGRVDVNISYFEELPDIKPVEEKTDVVYQTYTNGRWQPNVKNTEDYAGVFGLPVTSVYANLTKGIIKYKVHTKNGRWLPPVTNRDDYAGILGKEIDGFMAMSDDVNIRYRVHLLNGEWLPWVTGYSEKDSNNGYAGILNKTIDAIQIEII